jgi:hypothetical protein
MIINSSFVSCFLSLFVFLSLNADDNQLFCLSSSLVDHTSVNAVVMFRFSDDWQTVIGRRVIPLPTQV